MKMIRSLVVGVFFILTANIAHAVPIGLGIGIDASNSISGGDWILQRDAYVSQLDALLPIDGTVAVGVWKFSTDVTEVHAFEIIDSQVKKDALLANIAAMTQDALFTNIAGAIDAAAAAMDAFGLGDLDRALIDVSTDGLPTAGGDPLTAANAAVALGVDQVNCLGVGGSADCGFIAGDGAFAIEAETFADFEDALNTKLGREIGNVPEPVTTLLIAVGLMGLGVVRKRQAV